MADLTNKDVDKAIEDFDRAILADANLAVDYMIAGELRLIRELLEYMVYGPQVEQEPANDDE